jgi:hypothetical protein
MRRDKEQGQMAFSRMGRRGAWTVLMVLAMMGAGLAGTASARTAPATATAATTARAAGLHAATSATGASAPAVARRGTFYLGALGGGTTFGFNYGNASDVPLMCDWTGDGTSGVGVFRAGVWYIRKNLGNGPADFAFSFGSPGDTPVCGDWTGRGFAQPGVVRQGIWYLRASLTSGGADIVAAFGNAGDRPVVGHWTGSRVAGLGVVRGGIWYLRSTPSSGPADLAPFAYGNPTDIPVAGDWTAAGHDAPGVVRGGTWYLRNSLTSGGADRSFLFGNPGDVPLTWILGSYLWGVDTVDNVMTTNDVTATRNQLGAPAFIGRYLIFEAGNSLGPDEVTYIHNQGIRILTIVDQRNRTLTGAAVGQAEATQGVNQARAMGVPLGKALFRDVEVSDPIDAAYITAWAETVASAGYVPGMYENPINGAFAASYCSAVAAVPALAGMAIWSDQPQTTGADPRQTAAPSWNPFRPACQNNTVAWQYIIRSGFPTIPAPNVDVNEFAASQAFLLW